jgi:dihydroorotase
MSDTTLIKNARLVNEGQINEGDLLIRKGRIERLDHDIRAPETARVIDAAGLHLLPGIIDDQVHFREPGLTHKGDIYSESRAAVAGGVTSFMDMPNTKPPTITQAEWDKKLAIGARNAAANYAFYFGATNDNIDAIRKLDPGRVCGVKIFMGASTGNMLVDNEEALSLIFRDAPVPITTHCESTPLIERNLERARQRYGDRIPVTEHPIIRDVEVCYVSTEKAVSLAREHQAQLHVLHLSTARELELFESGPVGEKSITCETCVHFLHFTDADYPALGNRIKCNPSIKSATDRDALIAGLAEQTIDIIATDHAPHTIEEKALDDYTLAPAGLPLVQDLLLGALELAHDGRLKLEQLVQCMAHNPAERFGVTERGFLREGYWADLVLVDLDGETPVLPERVRSRCGWSPFEGWTFNARICSTWINGALAFDGNTVIEHGASQALSFRRPAR